MNEAGSTNLERSRSADDMHERLMTNTSHSRGGKLTPGPMQRSLNNSRGNNMVGRGDAKDNPAGSVGGLINWSTPSLSPTSSASLPVSPSPAPHTSHRPKHSTLPQANIPIDHLHLENYCLSPDRYNGRPTSLGRGLPLHPPLHQSASYGGRGSDVRLVTDSTEALSLGCSDNELNEDLSDTESDDEWDDNEISLV